MATENRLSEPLAAVRWRGGRGKKRFSFTLEDIAKVGGLSVGGLRTAIYRKHFDPTNLESLVIYLAGPVLKRKLDAK